MWLRNIFTIKNFDELALKDIQDLEKEFVGFIDELQEIHVFLVQLIKSRKEGKSLRNSHRENLIQRLNSTERKLRKALEIEKHAEKEERKAQHEEERQQKVGKYETTGGLITISLNQLKKDFGNKKIRVGGDTPNADIRFKGTPGELYYSLDLNERYPSIAFVITDIEKDMGVKLERSQLTSWEVANKNKAINKSLESGKAEILIEDLPISISILAYHGLIGGKYGYMHVDIVE